MKVEILVTAMKCDINEHTYYLDQMTNGTYSVNLDERVKYSNLTQKDAIDIFWKITLKHPIEVCNNWVPIV